MLFHETVLAVQTEPYALVPQGNAYVAAGYGRNAGVTNSYLAFRLTATGQRDPVWGGGGRLVDPSGANLGNHARAAVALPGGKTLIVGSTGPANMSQQDAALVMLDANGALDAAYGTGVHTMPLGANGNDQFWAAAVSGDQVLVVGYQGGGQAQTATMNDDSFGLLLPVR